MTRREDIKYELGSHWVLQTEDGTYEVYRNELTHSVRCARIGYKGADGLTRAMNECVRRELAKRK